MAQCAGGLDHGERMRERKAWLLSHKSHTRIDVTREHYLWLCEQIEKTRPMTIEEQIIAKLEAETEVSTDRDYVDSPSRVTGNGMTGRAVETVDIKGPSLVVVTRDIDEEARQLVCAIFNVDGHDVEFEAELVKQVGQELSYTLIY